jgi:prepilin-type N-terminal cleavage/methylation domain-containing protein
VGLFVFSSVLFLGLNAWVFHAYGQSHIDLLAAMGASGSGSGEALARLSDEHLGLMVRLLIFSFSFLILSVSFLLILSHRTAGPLYRFRKTFQQVQAGGRGARIRLRPTDDRELREIGDEFNRMMDRLEEGAREPAAAESKVSGESGFTLIEMLVVTALVGILVVSGGSFLDYLNRSQRGSRQSAEYTSLLSQVQLALSNTASCAGSLIEVGLKLPSNALEEADFYDKGRVIRLANGTLVADGVSDPGNAEKGLRVSGLHFERGSLAPVGPGQYIVNLKLKVDRFPAGAGAPLPERQIPVKLVVDEPTGAVSTCTAGGAISGGAATAAASCPAGSFIVAMDPSATPPVVCEPSVPCQEGENVVFQGGHWECSLPPGDAEAMMTRRSCLGPCP